MTQPVTIPLSLTGVTGHFNMKKSTQEEYNDEEICKIDHREEAPPWAPSSHEFSQMEQSMQDYR